MTDDNDSGAPKGAPQERDSRSPQDDASQHKTVLQTLHGRTGHSPKVLLKDEGSSHAASPMIDARSPAARELPSGRGNYQVLGEIARGGMGVVLKGHDTDLGRDVAMKVLLEEHAGDEAIVDRFVEEAQIGGQLQHPGIVPVYELGLMADERPFFTMKLVKGRTLAALLADRKAPGDDRRRLLAIFEQVCQTMAYAHSRKVIHRDLKPANVMVGAFGEVQVVDWGLAKVIREGGVTDERRAQAQKVTQVSIIETVRSAGTSTVGTHSLVGSVMGTPPYMSPEQAQGEVDELDERTDVFALGAILCEILTGQPPYRGKQDKLLVEAAKALQDDAKSRLSACGADAELVELVTSCLTPSKGARPAHAGEVAEQLHGYMSGLEERARQAEVAAARAAHERKARRLTLALASTVLVAVVAGGMIMRNVELDRVARQAQLVEAVNGLLEEAQLQRGQGDLDGAVVTAERAEATLAASADSVSEAEAHVAEFLTTVREEAAAARAEREAAARTAALTAMLDEIQVEPDLGSPIREDNVRMDARFVQAFQDFGLDPFAGEVADVAERLAATGHLEELGLALDEWARTQLMLAGWGSVPFERLIELARAVDPDPWRDRMRQAVKADDKGALRSLAASEEAREQAPATVVSFFLYRWYLGHRDIDLLPMMLACRTRHPGHPTVNHMLGVEYRLSRIQERDPAEAARYLTAAHALDPRKKFTVANLAIALCDIERYDEAVSVYAEALRTLPASAQDWLLHAWPYDRVNDRLLGEDAADAMAALCEAALRLDPDHETALNNLAWGLVTHPDPGRWDPERAVQLGRRIVEIRPEPMSWNTLGVALYRKGDLRGCLQYLRDSIAETDGYDADWLFCAMALHRLGRPEEARQAYDRGLRLAEQSMLERPDTAYETQAFLVEAQAVLGIDD